MPEDALYKAASDGNVEASMPAIRATGQLQMILHPPITITSNIITVIIITTHINKPHTPVVMVAVRGLTTTSVGVGECVFVWVCG